MTDLDTTSHTVPVQADVPTAVTLDDATLRRVFADAPADLVVPKDVGSLFTARIRTMGGSGRSPLLAVWIGALFGGVLVGLVFQQPLGWLLASIAIVVAIVAGLWVHGKAADDFFDRYAAARGLTHIENAYVSASVPLFNRGDERSWPRVLEGAIAGQHAKVAQYTYTDISYDDEGRRQKTNFHFTTVCLRLPDAVAARFAGVYLSPKKFGFGAIQDKLAHDRKVELESADFARRYTLRVVDSQDDIALYELFSTSFVHTLSTSLTAFWEQRGHDLVVWHKGHESEAADLDRMCLEAWHVLHRYLEEHR